MVIKNSKDKNTDKTSENTHYNEVPIDDKIKALPIEQQLYIKGLIDGVLLCKDKTNHKENHKNQA